MEKNKEKKVQYIKISYQLLGKNYKVKKNDEKLKKLTSNGKILYSYLLNEIEAKNINTNNSSYLMEISTSELANIINISKRSVIYILKELENWSLIDIKKAKGKKNIIKVKSIDNSRFFQFEKTILHEKYSNIDNSSKLLYYFLKNDLSNPKNDKNIEKDNKKFILFTRKEISEEIGLSPKAVQKNLDILEQNNLLTIIRNKPHPNKIYINDLPEIKQEEQNADEENPEEIEESEYVPTERYENVEQKRIPEVSVLPQAGTPQPVITVKDSIQLGENLGFNGNEKNIDPNQKEISLYWEKKNEENEILINRIRNIKKISNEFSDFFTDKNEINVLAFTDSKQEKIRKFIEKSLFEDDNAFKIYITDQYVKNLEIDMIEYKEIMINSFYGIYQELSDINVKWIKRGKKEIMVSVACKFLNQIIHWDESNNGYSQFITPRFFVQKICKKINSSKNEIKNIQAYVDTVIIDAIRENHYGNGE